jgi:MoxR-like ATPase
MSNKMNQFQGSSDYVVSDELMHAVNVAIALQKPLLIKGEPGTGKTMLAESISKALNKKLIIWNIKSTTKAQEGLYVYDTVQRCTTASLAKATFPISKNTSSWGSWEKRFVPRIRLCC